MWMAERLRNVKKSETKRTRGCVSFKFHNFKRHFGMVKSLKQRSATLLVCLALDVGSKLTKLYISVGKKKRNKS